MATILVCTGMGEPQGCSNMGLIYGFRKLGHDVITCGPPYWDRGYDADIVMEDKTFPEQYSYEEVLAKIGNRHVDLILQIEPHFFLVGPKPPEIISVYFFTDAHTNGIYWKQAASWGEFNRVFCCQKNYLPFFQDIPGIRYLPVGFDERRFPPLDNIGETLFHNPLVDITFVGYSGIANLQFPKRNFAGAYTINVGNLPDGVGRYASHAPTYDYAERAEMLIRLSKDFRVRIYNNVWETPHLQHAILSGAIGFNRSLLKDTNIRNFEIMAAGRLLVTDKILYQDELFRDGVHCLTYPTWYKPFTQNFDLEYEYVRNLICDVLDDMPRYEIITKQAKDLVWRFHTWTHRAQSILNSL